MKDPTTKPPEHPDALLLPYVEETLGPEDLAALRDHLRECARCSAEVEALRQTAAMLRDNRHALCPEAERLYEVAVLGSRVETSLSRHLETCPRCREEMASYTAAATQEVMPQEIWSKVRERLAEPKEKPRAAAREEWDLRGFFSRLFRLPALGVAVAAAVLVIVVMAPWEGAQLPTWEHAPRPKAGGEIGRQRAAVVILFKHFEKPLSSQRISELYQALEPRIDVAERYDLVPPAALSGIIGKGYLDAGTRQGVLEGLRKKLNVPLAALVTIAPAAQGFQVQGELVNTATGALIAQNTAQATDEKDLSSVVTDQVREMLLKEGPGK